MGSSNAKIPFANDFAQIGITLEKPYYYPGEIINGKVLLIVLQPIPFKAIQFITLGKESTRFRYYELVGSKKRGFTGQGKRLILSSQVSLAQFQEIVAPGQYSFPFLMQIPIDVPPSYSFLAHGLINKAKVSYKFKAIANSGDPSIKNIASVLPLLILSKGPTGNIPKAVVNENEVLCCCCCDKGPCKLDVTFEKSNYILGEPMMVLINIDNSRCSVNVKALELKLMRRCTTISDVNPSLHASINDEIMHTTKYIQIKKFSKSLSPVGVMLDPKQGMNVNQLNALKRMPSCRGVLLDAFYILEVRAKFETAVCCTSDSPESSLIISLETNEYVQPISYKIPQNGWNPNESKRVELRNKVQDEETSPFAMKGK